MFFDRYANLCESKKISVYKACTDLGLNRSAVAKWKSGGTPNGTTIAKMADYFGVTTDYLLGEEKNEKAPALTDKDKRDAAKAVERIMSDLENSGDLMFDGVPISEEARDALSAAMKIGLETARLRNKKKYTPRKYRK